MPSTPKNSYIRLTIGEKLKLCEVASLERRTLNELSEWATRAFDLPRKMPISTVRGILAERHALEAHSTDAHAWKKAMDPALEDYESALVAMFQQMEAEVKTVTDWALIRLAQHVADVHCLPVVKWPGFSKGRVYRFKRRHSIKYKRKAASVSLACVTTGRKDMRELTDKYALQDVYNMDESSFFYREDPPRTLSRKAKVAGYKADKTRITVCVATNADGSDKLPLFFISKSKCPRDFKGEDLGALGVEYTNTKKAWMTSTTFTAWLHTLNLRMQREERHILLLVDNASSHSRPVEPLSNIRLEFLPKNTTSFLQPMDQGVITSLKRGFRNLKIDDSVDRFIRRAPQQRVGVSTALRWAKLAWDGISATTISNCWRHSGIVRDKHSLSHILQV